MERDDNSTMLPGKADKVKTEFQLYVVAKQKTGYMTHIENHITCTQNENSVQREKRSQRSTDITSCYHPH